MAVLVKLSFVVVTDWYSHCNMQLPYIETGFLSQESCFQLLDWLVRADCWEAAAGDWHDRCINLHLMSEHIRSQMLNLQQQVTAKIQQHWNRSEPLYADLFQFVRWRTGDQLYPPHADAEHIDGSLHPFAHRQFASIIYLNNDYTGGEIYFPNFNLQPSITTGTLAIFPSSLDYLHGVHAVTSGTRYTIAGFFTNQIAHAHRYTHK